MRHTTPRPGVYYGWLIVATTFWMAIFTGGGRTGFGIFVLPMSTELGWSRGTISLAAALGALISGVSQPFVGRLYDRVGGRRLILVCLLLSGLGTALLALTQNLVFLILVFGVLLSIAQAGSSLTTPYRRFLLGASAPHPRGIFPLHPQDLPDGRPSLFALYFVEDANCS